MLRWLLAAVAGAVVCAALARAPLPGGSPGPWLTALARLRADRGAMAALCVIVALSLGAALAPLLAPHDPSAQLDILALKGQPPSLVHPFGTDIFSRDVLSRVLHGGRVSLGVALLAVALSTTIGTAYGAVAGWYGGRVDAVLMRLNDAFLAIPRVLLLLAVLSFWGRVPTPALVLILGLTGWFAISRLVRAEVLAVRERDFVVAARALGVGPLRIVLRHVLPNVLSPLVVATTLGVGSVITLEAGLSYLGIGVQQPQASWGSIIHDGGDQLVRLWWVSLFPGLAIVTTVMAFNALGDGLRDALDPRQLHSS